MSISLERTVNNVLEWRTPNEPVKRGSETMRAMVKWNSIERAIRAAFVLLLAAILGCGGVGTQPGPLFYVPLTVEGRDVGAAIIDTGGEYEVMLRDRFGLPVTGELDVLLFAGRELVNITGPLSFTAGGYSTTADFAIVDLPICECNGVGVNFFRKTGVVLALDFRTRIAAFTATVPQGGTTLAFRPSPGRSVAFDTAFAEVTVSRGDQSVNVIGLLDTGTNSTLLRRGLVNDPADTHDYLPVELAHDRLGTLVVNARLFDTEGLPDVVLGTDAMGAWGERWYFTFAHEGGTVTVFPSVASPVDDRATETSAGSPNVR